MSVILVNTLQIKFLRIRFLFLKSQHSLAGVVLQNKTEDRSPDPWTRRDLSHLEWDVLFLGKYFQLSLKKSHSPQEKHSRSYRTSKNELESSQCGYNLFGGSFSWWWGIWSWLMPLLILVITILMLLTIAPCIINCLTHFVSAQVNRLQHPLPV